MITSFEKCSTVIFNIGKKIGVFTRGVFIFTTAVLSQVCYKAMWGVGSERNILHIKSKKLVYPNGDSLFCFQQSLPPTLHKTAVYSLRVSSCLPFFSCEKDLRNGS